MLQDARAGPRLQERCEHSRVAANESERPVDVSYWEYYVLSEFPSPQELIRFHIPLAIFASISLRPVLVRWHYIADLTRAVSSHQPVMVPWLACERCLACGLAP